MTKRLSSQDRGYRAGDLSIFPTTGDTRENLYVATNNAETTLKHSMTVSSKHLVVDDPSRFPDSGLLKITLADGGGLPEVIHYSRRVANQFHDLHRGFGGFRRSSWPAGSLVSLPVMADHHNVLKDAIIQIERKIGLADHPGEETLHGKIISLEKRWLTPKALFRAYPRDGGRPLTVRFQNFSTGHGVRFLWDFGDGATSTERSPIHTFGGEGDYTVKMTMVSSNGARGIVEKPNYIRVGEQAVEAFYYVTPLVGYSAQTASTLGMKPTTFELVDQTDADVVERHWYFADGEDLTEPNPNKHSVRYVFRGPGEYQPTLIVRLADGRLVRGVILDKIMVL